MTDFGTATMWWGCSSNSASKALRKMEESHVMVSYASTGRLWDWIEYSFLDSGGYSLMLETGEHPPVEEYMGYVQEGEPTWFALQDFPCEPEILEEYDRTVEEHQRRTTERARKCLDYHQDRGLKSEPISVIQGWKVEEYLNHVDQMREAGCLTDTVGIGSICRRGQDDKICNVIRAVSEALPERCNVHCFGVKNNILSRNSVRDAIDSVDSSAWYYQMYKDKPVPEPAWHTCIWKYLDYRRTLYDHFDVAIQAPDNQHELTNFEKQ